MTGKILAKYVINKGNMLVLLNLQQMGLIFENHIKGWFVYLRKVKFVRHENFKNHW